MLAHSDAFPIIILIAILHCMVYYYGENFGNILLVLAIELPKTMIMYASANPKTFEDRLRLVKIFVEHLTTEKQLPSTALKTAITGINKGSYSIQQKRTSPTESSSTGNPPRNFRRPFRRSFVTKKNQNSGRNNTNNSNNQVNYHRHYCHGPTCTFRGCAVGKKSKN